MRQQLFSVLVALDGAVGALPEVRDRKPVGATRRGARRHLAHVARVFDGLLDFIGILLGQPGQHTAHRGRPYA